MADMAHPDTPYMSGNINLQHALKAIIKNGTTVLWAEKNAYDATITKKKWEGGKFKQFHLTTAAGGAGMGGISSQRGQFVKADTGTGINGQANAKFQTSTFEIDRFSEKYSKSEAQAHISETKINYKNLISIHRSEINSQKLGDGTGRKATVVGIGSLDANSGATFLHRDSTALPIKIGSGVDVVGSIANLYENAFISLVCACYDGAKNGTLNLLETTAEPRLVILEVSDGATNEYYDAFRVVKYDQMNQTVWVMPGRMANVDSAVVGEYTHKSFWHTENTVADRTCRFQYGMTFAGGAAPARVTTVDIAHVINPAGKQAACFLVHPNYLPKGETSYGNLNLKANSYTTESKTAVEIGRLMLGLGWAPDTKIDMINPFVCTGFDTLLRNEINTVHGIPRSQVLQMMPTVSDNRGRTLDVSTFTNWLTAHEVRNEGEVPKWTTIQMNSVVYNRLMTFFAKELIVDTNTKGLGGFPAVHIVHNGNRYQLVAHPGISHDVIFAIPKEFVTQYGYEVEAVDVGGVSTFLGVDSNGVRRNTEVMYFTTDGELMCDNLRQCAILKNFTLP